MDLNDKILSLELENKNLKALTSSTSSVPGGSPIATYKETFKPAKPVFTKTIMPRLHNKALVNPTQLKISERN